MTHATPNHPSRWPLFTILLTMLLGGSLLLFAACSSTNDDSSPTGPNGSTGLDGSFWLVDLEAESDLAVFYPVDRVLPGDKIYLFDGDSLHMNTKGDSRSYPIEVREDTLFIDWGAPGSDPQPVLIQATGDTIRLVSAELSISDPNYIVEVFVKRPADLNRDVLDEQLRDAVSSYWDDPDYRELEYLVASDPDKVDAGQVFAGTRDDWAALAWGQKQAYLPWTFAYSLARNPGDDLEMYQYCRNIVIQPEQFGYMWADWLEDQTPSEVLATARGNGYKWPGGSAEFEAILELYDTAWDYPEE